MTLRWLELSSGVVEAEETEDSSSSSPPKLSRLVLLFFRGKGGSILPGSSDRILLWSLTKSPYLLPRSVSWPPGFLTRRTNSYTIRSQRAGSFCNFESLTACV